MTGRTNWSRIKQRSLTRRRGVEDIKGDTPIVTPPANKQPRPHRASEVCNLRWDQIELGSGRLHVRRAKGGIDNVHPLSGREIRALRQLRRENTESRYVFVTERGGPTTTAGFLKTIARTGEAARLSFPVHPHMLRHSTGYKLANDGHDTRALQHYMGHKNIMHTVRYTEMAPDRFKNFWKD
jgi:type 1 fimbriae regulatory protein FimE